MYGIGASISGIAQYLGIKTKMHYKIRDFLLAMLQLDFDFKSSYDQKATEKVCNVCCELLKEYVQTHCHKKVKTTRVFQDISVNFDEKSIS